MKRLYPNLVMKMKYLTNTDPSNYRLIQQQLLINHLLNSKKILKKSNLERAKYTMFKILFKGLYHPIRHQQEKRQAHGIIIKTLNSKKPIIRFRFNLLMLYYTKNLILIKESYYYLNYDKNPNSFSLHELNYHKILKISLNKQIFID